MNRATIIARWAWHGLTVRKMATDANEEEFIDLLWRLADAYLASLAALVDPQDLTDAALRGAKMYGPPLFNSTAHLELKGSTCPTKI